MDVINRLKAKYNLLTTSHNYRIFMKFGAPMIIFCVGGSFLMEEFQIIRQDYLRDKYNKEMMDDLLKQRGADKVDLRAEYEKIQNADTSNYKNIRGPRVYEDNSEFLQNRETQEKRLQQILGKDPETPTSSQQNDMRNTA